MHSLLPYIAQLHYFKWRINSSWYGVMIAILLVSSFLAPSTSLAREGFCNFTAFTITALTCRAFLPLLPSLLALPLLLSWVFLSPVLSILFTTLRLIHMHSMRSLNIALIWMGMWPIPSNHRQRSSCPVLVSFWFTPFHSEFLTLTWKCRPISSPGHQELSRCSRQPVRAKCQTSVGSFSHDFL